MVKKEVREGHRPWGTAVRARARARAGKRGRHQRRWLDGRLLFLFFVLLIFDRDRPRYTIRLPRVYQRWGSRGGGVVRETGPRSVVRGVSLGDASEV